VSSRDSLSSPGQSLPCRKDYRVTAQPNLPSERASRKTVIARTGRPACAGAQQPIGIAMTEQFGAEPTFLEENRRKCAVAVERLRIATLR
jgi:hypothetical protein